MKVSEKRFDEVWEELHDKLDGWYPKFNNAHELYLQNGSDWGKVDASKIVNKLEDWKEPYEAWKDMPQTAIEYLKNLPEFDADIFKQVTGINVEQQVEEMTVEEVCKALGKNVKIVK